MKLIILAFLACWGVAVSCFAAAAPTPANPTESGEPLFRYGVFADVQYADKPDTGKRHYRESLARLENCAAALNQEGLSFVVNLGDLIDGNGIRTSAEWQQVMQAVQLFEPKVYHVLGNHCLEMARTGLIDSLAMPLADRAACVAGRGLYYSFEKAGWRFIVLDTMEVSVKAPAGTLAARQAVAYLRARPQLPTYNGAISAEQKAWLATELADASERKQKVIVFAHHPILVRASDESHLAWNHAEVLQVLESAGNVAAFLCGHDHRGGYARQAGIHHITLPGMVEASPNAYAVVEVYADEMRLRVFSAPQKETFHIP